VLQFVFQTTNGPIGIIGINDENLRRLQAGMPLDINLKNITPPGTRINRIVVHYSHTYEDVIKDMREGDLPIPDTLMEKAKQMDQQLKAEKKAP
jgi:hypothetical protein